jgi:gamma-glutamyl-gamma-aminobutyrate hydrolase PuuD
LVQGALARRLPVLGICRGLQIISVALGGTLHQHLPEVVGHDGHAPAYRRMGSHHVWVTAGSRLADILGPHSPAATAVPTRHHQAIDRLGTGLAATAWAADGTIEAAELDSADHPFLIGVQWHPEAGDDLSVFRALVAVAGYRHARSELEPVVLHLGQWGTRAPLPEGALTEDAGTVRPGRCHGGCSGE